VPKDERDVYFGGAGVRIPTAVYERAALPVGAALEGPAVIEEAMSTTLLHPGQTLDVDLYGNFIIHTASRSVE
jgi:N-methylhydantoinase A